MEKILRWNPEFAKNLWLEFSPQRLIAMPAIILLVVILIFSNVGDSEAWQIINYASLSGFIIIGYLWGIKTAADAILDEYNEKTWDWQKMSIIGPWKLAVGKLFGSTIYNWYGAGFCWLLYMLSAPFMKNPANEYKIGLLLILGMISLHGLMILISLQVVKKNDGKTKIKSNRIFISGILVLAFISRILSLSFGLDKNIFSVSWYGISGSATDMAIIGCIFYCGWIIAGLYRSMRAELQYFDTPNWWVAFLVSNFLFQYGYLVGLEQIPVSMGIAVCLAINFVQCIAIVYFLALSDSKDIVNFRALQNAWRQNNFSEFLKTIPLWLLTIPVAFGFGLLAVVFYAISPAQDAVADLMKETRIESTGKAFLVLISVLGFVIRDMGIMLLLNFSPRAKRADAAMMIYLVLLYMLLPMLMRNFGIASAFFPDVMGNPFLMVAFPLLEAGVVIYFLFNRWKAISAQAIKNA